MQWIGKNILINKFKHFNKKRETDQLDQPINMNIEQGNLFDFDFEVPSGAIQGKV